LRLSQEQRDALLAELGTIRDRAQQLEARVASEEERTTLAQKEIQQRDIRIEDLMAALDSTQAALTGEKKLTEEGRAQVVLLNQQMAALRDQLNQLTAALGAAESKGQQQEVQIADLGRRLNLALASKVEELARYRSEFFGRLREVLGTRQDVRIVGDRFVFQSEVLFPSASATLEEAGKDQLARLASTLLDIARKIPPEVTWILRVDGHTDLRPIATAQFPSNWELSTARAISVVKFLVDHGVPSDRLVAAGFGEYQPLDPGRSEDAFGRNRRIEIKLDQR
jgi:chemotaxis protein MotB